MKWKFWENWFKSSENKDVSLDETPSPQVINDVDETVPNQRDSVEETAAAKHPTIYITQNLLERTCELLASFAEKTRSEGVVYWFGFELGETAVVTTLVVPNADTRWGCIRTTPQVNAQALSAIVGTPLMLVGQAHSHPGSGVRHSDTDDKETFASFDGCISVVVPHFGQEGINLETCGIHRHINGVFHYIDTSEISNHISVLPGEADFRAKAQTNGSIHKSQD